MHQVNTKQRRTLVLRFFTYGAMLILTTLTTVLLLYLALGYRIGTSGNVVRNGLLLVNNKPESAQVYINGEKKDSQTPSRFVVPAGKYDIELRLNGYHNWNKKVRVSASKVKDATYAFLIPKELKKTALAEMQTPDMVSQSEDRKYILTYANASSAFQLITLDEKEPEVSNLALGNSIKRESGQLGTFEVIEWAGNDKHVLLKQILPSGEVNFLSLDVTNPAEAINISSVYGDMAPEAIHYVGDGFEDVYGTKNGVLSQYNIVEASSVVLMQNIRNYFQYGDDTILFSRQLEDGLMQVGIFKDKKTTVIEQVQQDAGEAILTYGNYEDHFYFVVAYSQKDTVTIYRDPLQTPILAKQLPFAVLAFSKPTKIELSKSNELLLAQNGKSMVVYDFEDVDTYRYDLPFELAPNSSVDWIDNYHLQAVDSENTSMFYDYDGTNSHAINSVRPGSRIYYSNDYKFGYSFNDMQGRTVLSAVSLVAENR